MHYHDPSVISLFFDKYAIYMPNPQIPWLLLFQQFRSAWAAFFAAKKYRAAFFAARILPLTILFYLDPATL
jgi:hypothetical protein